MRGRVFLFVGGAGVALALLGQIDGLPPIAAAAVTVASSVGLALLAHGGPALASEAVAFGASGALAYEASRPYLPLVASGLLLTFVFGTRAMRSQSWRELAFHLAAAFAGGVAASWVAQAHAGVETSLWLLAVVMAALLASIPWIVPSDAPRTFALRKLAGRAQGRLRWRLLRAVVAHRRLADAELPAGLSKRVDRAFDELARRVERRVDARRLDHVDPDVDRAVTQLVRVSRMARRHEELIERLDHSTHELSADSESLANEVAALAEMG